MAEYWEGWIKLVMVRWEEAEEPLGERGLTVSAKWCWRLLLVVVAVATTIVNVAIKNSKLSDREDCDDGNSRGGAAVVVLISQGSLSL